MRAIVERKTRGLFRRTPEQMLIDHEASAGWAQENRASRRCPLEDALYAALVEYADAYGWPEAKGWLAARAHEPPQRTRDARQTAERAFRSAAA